MLLTDRTGPRWRAQLEGYFDTGARNLANREVEISQRMSLFDLAPT